MASQIRKGFFFYFGIAVLVLVAFFMVCVVIMMFNPGSSILWMQYFSNNDTNFVNATTDDETEIDFASITKVEVNCGYANVTVSYDNDSSTYNDNGVYIVNNAKGFVASSAATPFTYSVTLDEGILMISVTEPSGFLYFSKDVQIVVHSSSNKEDQYRINFDSIAFEINTNGGDVSIGGTKNVADDVDQLSVKSLTVYADGDGDITLTKNFDTTSVESLSLRTSGGAIKSTSAFVAYGTEDTSTTGIKATCDVNLTTNSGRIELNEIFSSGVVNITNDSGDVVLGNVYATNLNFTSCVSGNYALTKYAYNTDDGTTGSVTFGLNTSVLQPYVKFGTINGDFLFESKVDSSRPTIIITEVTGNFHVYSYAGSVTVGAIYGETIEINADGAMKIDVVIDDADDTTSPSKTIVVKNTSAAVRLGFATDMSAYDVQVTTESSAVTIDFTSGAKFVATSYSDDTESELLSMDNITFKIGNNAEAKNPFEFDSTGSDGTIKIITTGKVYFNLVDAEDL